MMTDYLIYYQWRADNTIHISDMHNETFVSVETYILWCPTNIAYKFHFLVKFGIRQSRSGQIKTTHITFCVAEA